MQKNIYLHVTEIIEKESESLKNIASYNRGRTLINGEPVVSAKVDIELAKLAKVSDNTLRRVRYINQVNDQNIINQLSNNQISINKAFNILKGGYANLVYFILAENNKIKIGSTNNMEGRLSSLSIISPCKLELLGVIEGDHKKEKELHKKFKHIHSHGEWFNQHPELLKFIKNNSKAYISQ